MFEYSSLCYKSREIIKLVSVSLKKLRSRSLSHVTTCSGHCWGENWRMYITMYPAVHLSLLWGRRLELKGGGRHDGDVSAYSSPSPSPFPFPNNVGNSFQTFHISSACLRGDFYNIKKEGRLTGSQCGLFCGKGSESHFAQPPGRTVPGQRRRGLRLPFFSTSFRHSGWLITEFIGSQPDGKWEYQDC